MNLCFIVIVMAIADGQNSWQRREIKTVRNYNVISQKKLLWEKFRERERGSESKKRGGNCCLPFWTIIKFFIGGNWGPNDSKISIISLCVTLDSLFLLSFIVFSKIIRTSIGNGFRSAHAACYRSRTTFRNWIFTGIKCIKKLCLEMWEKLTGICHALNLCML